MRSTAPFASASHGDSGANPVTFLNSAQNLPHLLGLLKPTDQYPAGPPVLGEPGYLLYSYAVAPVRSTGPFGPSDSACWFGWTRNPLSTTKTASLVSEPLEDLLPRALESSRIDQKLKPGHPSLALLHGERFPYPSI